MKVVRKRPETIHEEIADNYHNIVGSFFTDSHNEVEQQEDKQEAKEEENLRQRRQARIQRMMEDEPKPGKTESDNDKSTGTSGTLLIAVLLAMLLFILLMLSNKRTSPGARQTPGFTMLQPIYNSTDQYTFRQSTLEF